MGFETHHFREIKSNHHHYSTSYSYCSQIATIFFLISHTNNFETRMLKKKNYFQNFGESNFEPFEKDQMYQPSTYQIFLQKHCVPRLFILVCQKF
jgi:hypothetical protein